jgi:hypothetical protein
MILTFIWIEKIELFVGTKLLADPFRPYPAVYLGVLCIRIQGTNFSWVRFWTKLEYTAPVVCSGEGGSFARITAQLSCPPLPLSYDSALAEQVRRLN